MSKRIGTCLLLVAVISSATLCIGWGKKARTTEDLLKIALLGGGLVLDASTKDANDLLKIAAATSSGGGTLYLKNCGGIETTNLMFIASAGSGHVVIDF
jgi:hypothetical protein